MMQRILAVTLLILGLAGTATAQSQDITDSNWDKSGFPSRANSRQLSFEIHGEGYELARTIRVQLPRGYEEGGQFPVLYVLDADWNFPLAASYMDYLAYRGRVPETLIVGVDNINRNADFVTPTDTNFPMSGKQQRFLDFVENELMPEVNTRFRTNGFDTLFGHSFGGVVTLAIMFNMPDLFDAHIAVGSSQWVSGRNSFDIANSFFEQAKELTTFLYLSHAEFDGGDTVPANFEFWSLLKRRSSPGFEIYFKEYPDTNHFTAVMPTFIDAMEKLYPAKSLERALEQSVRQDGVRGFDKWLDHSQRSLGPRFMPQIMELGLLAYRLAGEGHQEAAIAIADWLVEAQPNRQMGYELAAHTHLRSGNREKALQYLDRVIAIARSRKSSPNQRRSYQALRNRLLQN